MSTFCQRLACLALLFALLACDGNNKSPTGDPVTDLLLQHPENNLVNFFLAGNAICSSCLADNFPVAGVYIKVVVPEDPTVVLAEGVFPQLGPFSFPKSVRYVKNAALLVEGSLLREGNLDDFLEIPSETTITTPSENGKTLAFTIKFRE